MIDEAQERERFEALYSNRVDCRRIAVGQGHVYCEADTARLWEGWLAAKRDAAQDADRWLPIESAPKDCEVWLGWEGVKVARGYWQDEVRALEDELLLDGTLFYSKGDVVVEADWLVGDEGFPCRDNKPTHWKEYKCPLPPPPAAAQSEGEAHES